MKASKLIVFGCSITAALFMSNVSAQDTYVKVSPGYSFGIGEYGVYQDRSASANSAGTGFNTTYKSVKLTYGSGLNFGGAIGHMVNENMGFELGISMLFSNSVTFKDAVSGSTSDYSSTYEESATMIRFMPAFVLSAGKKQVNPYAKFGLVLGKGSIVENYKESGEFNIEQQMRFSGGTAVGFHSAVGLEVGSQKAKFFGEVSYIGLSYEPTRGETELFTVNGQDVMSQAPTYLKEFEVVEERTVSDTDPVVQTSPSKRMKQTFPFSSFGLNVGFRFTL